MSTDSATIQYWTELAEYDLRVAQSLREKGHYLYVGFMCHQSVEKMLKALYVKQHNEAPPFIHKLDRLIDMAGLEGALSEEHLT